MNGLSNDMLCGLGLMAIQEPETGIISTGITAPTVLPKITTITTTPLIDQIKLPAPVIPITTSIPGPIQQVIAPTIQQQPSTTILPNNNCTDCGGDTVQQIAPGEPTPGQQSFDLMDWAKKNWWLLVIGAGVTYLIMKKNRNNGN